MNAALALLWGGLVLAVAWRWRPPPPRVAGMLPDAFAAPRWSVPEDPRLRRWGLALVATLLAWPVLPLLAPVAGVTAWAVPVVRARRRAGAATDLVRRSLPEVVDLLSLTVGAGLSVAHAVSAVAARDDGPIGRELGRAVVEVEQGRRVADALAATADRLGPDARPVLDALVASERYGTPLGEALARLSADVRADRTRRAEEAARKVSVKLLFPLVLCVLPAFGLLTVAPMLAGALGSLRL